MRTRWEQRRDTAAQVEVKRDHDALHAASLELIAMVAHPGVTLGKVSGDVHIHSSREPHNLKNYCDDAAAVLGLRLVWRKAKHSRISHGLYDTVQSASITWSADHG